MDVHGTGTGTHRGKRLVPALTFRLRTLRTEVQSSQHKR